MILAGIDFGSKTAGTTVICFGLNKKTPKFICSEKKQDADEWLVYQLNKIKPDLVFIDAPLSFPKSLIENDITGNFLYRKADIKTGAMSPLFLGTYTARAIKLKLQFKNTIPFYETYPSALIKYIDEIGLYDKKQKTVPNSLLQKINKISQVNVIQKSIINLHFFDAYLCWTSAKRFTEEKCLVFGDESEGLIYI